MSNLGDTANKAFYQVIRTFSALAYHTLFAYKVENSERIPKGGAVVIVANHTRFLDVPATALSTGRYIRFVAKEELSSLGKEKMGAFIAKGCGAIFVGRGNTFIRRGREAIEKIRKNIEYGEVIGIYPQGTRSAPDVIGEYHSNGIELILKAEKHLEKNVAFVPEYIEHKKNSRRQTRVIVGEPIYSNGRSAKELTDILMQEIAKMGNLPINSVS